MNTKESHSITRRNFCRTLALPAGALVLGSAWPVFAAKPSAAKKPQKGNAPSAPAPSEPVVKKYETKVLWDFDGCIENRFMQRVHPTVFNGNAYLFILLPGLKTMIVKVPLDGSKVQMFPLMPGHVTGDDPHRFYAFGFDSLGYVHVSGDMHSSPFVKHWVSKKPEDVSEFVFVAGKDSNKGPQGETVTYPKFYRSPEGVLYHKIRSRIPPYGTAISVLDIKSQTWTMLGADVPAEQLHGKAKNKKTKGKPITAWEDNGEGGDYDYTQPWAAMAWGTDKRMHMAFALLNENTPNSQGRHTLTHALYAYSDDGGKTIHRGDGSPIQWPIRAEAGPHQGDVVYSEHEGKPPWLDVSLDLIVDEKNRPVVSVVSKKTGKHSLVLDKGKWTELRGASSQASLQTADPNEEDEEEGFGKIDFSKLHLPYAPDKVDHDYLRKTGNIVYTLFPEKDRFHNNKPKFHRIMVVLSKPLNGK